MTEQQNLSALHAKLEAGLSEGKCSPLCRAIPHPNARTAKPVSPAREAGSQL